MPAIDIDRDTAHQAAQRELDKADLPERRYDRNASTSGSTSCCTASSRRARRCRVAGSPSPCLSSLLVVAVVVAVRIARRTIRTRRGGDYQLFDARRAHRRPAPRNRGTVCRRGGLGRRDSASTARGRPRPRGERRAGPGCPAAPPANWPATPRPALPGLAAELSRCGSGIQRRHVRRTPGHPGRLPADRRSRRPASVRVRRQADRCVAAPDRRLVGRGPVTVAAVTSRRVRRRPWRWVLLALVVICAVAAVGTYLTAPRPGGRMDPRVDRRPTAPTRWSRCCVTTASTSSSPTTSTTVERAARPDTLLLSRQTSAASTTSSCCSGWRTRRATCCWSSRRRATREALAPEIRSARHRVRRRARTAICARRIGRERCKFGLSEHLPGRRRRP